MSKSNDTQFKYAVIIVVIWLLFLVQRRSRRALGDQLGLANARWISLRFLRRMVAEGMRIQCCQSLPEEAFGDPSKARALMVVSHRWLDRFTCDIPTAECPNGFRLDGMVSRLEKLFSPSSDATTSISRFRESYLLGGWDVLVFFDFMSLPQASEAGPRTVAEQQVFDRCLGEMGVLYSLFPVLVLGDVLPGNHGYFESGWCYSEYITALLGHQLGRYSSQAAALPEGTVLSKIAKQSGKERAVPALITHFSQEIQSKHFQNPADKPVVESIIRVFLYKRLLAEAIGHRRVESIGQILEKLRGMPGLLAKTLNQPVNDTLDTLLHLAVQCGDSEIVQLLVDYGASKQNRNLSGDTPTQCWGILRFWSRAARRLYRLRDEVQSIDRSGTTFARIAAESNFSNDGSLVMSVCLTGVTTAGTGSNRKPEVEVF